MLDQGDSSNIYREQPIMKIIHFADAHIGVETYGSIDPESGLSTRVLDELRAVDKVIDYAVNNRADLVLFCGDAYKNREPSPTHQREFARRIRRLSEAMIPTVLVVGNHDQPGSPGKANSVEIFETLDIGCIHIVHKPGILHIVTKSGDIQVAALPWLRRNALLVKDDVKNMGVTQVMEQMQEVLAARLTELASGIDAGRPAVLASHISVASAKAGTEKSMVIGADPVVMLSTIADPVYDYVALGHVHRNQVLCENPPVVYAGSLERLDFGDEKDEKGFYEIEIDYKGANKSVKYEFRKIGARKFLTLEVEIADGDLDPTCSVLRLIKENAELVINAVVRLRIAVPAQLAGLLKDAEILKALKEAYNVSIVREIGRISRVRGAGWSNKTLTPLEALDKYLEINNVAAERQNKLHEYAERMINEKLSEDKETYAG
jgi:exonuclease SbcD